MFALPTTFTPVGCIVLTAMISVPILAAFAALPGVQLFTGPILLIGDSCWALETQAGNGTPEIGQAVIASFVLTDGLDHVLADTEQRGLAFSFRYGSPEIDPLLQAAVEDMPLGSERVVFFGADVLPSGVGSIVPPKTELTLRISLSRKL